MTWQTRTLATFIAATVPVEKAGDVNPLLEVAQQIGETPEQTAAQTMPAGLDFDPENPPMPDLKDGSLDRFLGSFTNPGRWAGNGS